MQGTSGLHYNERLPLFLRVATVEFLVKHILLRRLSSDLVCQFKKIKCWCTILITSFFSITILYFMNEWISRLILCRWYFSCLEMYSENFFDIYFHGFFQIFLRVYKHSQKKRKDNLDGSLDQISFCSWTLVPENTNFQVTSKYFKRKR